MKKAKVKVYGDFDYKLRKRVLNGMKSAVKKGCKEITLVINSCGGRVDVLKDIVLAIERYRNFYDITINTHATKKAMSAGADLLSFGDYRTADCDACIMIHKALHSYDEPVWFNAASAKEMYESLNETDDALLSFLANNIGSTLEEVKEWIGDKDMYLTADEALACNVIDNVID